MRGLLHGLRDAGGAGPAPQGAPLAAHAPLGPPRSHQTAAGAPIGRQTARTCISMQACGHVLQSALLQRHAQPVVPVPCPRMDENSA